MKVICVVGTRPEAIKMAPVILALRECSWCELTVVATAQHRQMLDQVFGLFGITADIDLNLMRDNQTLADVTARALTGLDQVLADIRPDAVVAQGDTTTVLATAMACFYRRIPFCHVEAGLRTHDLEQPFPEEFNRVVASVVTRLHFAPTDGGRDHLLREHVPPANIHVTGNTVIDALLWMAAQQPALPVQITPGRRLILLTVHRRENFGEPLANICRAALALVRDNPDVELLLPVHPNPHVKETVGRLLGGQDRIHLTAPLEYDQFVAAMQRSHLILTDSGGVQEEAPSLRKPVLVMRAATERPEAITAGVALLVGTGEADIREQAQRLLDDEAHYAAMASGASPYGDGAATQRIIELLRGLSPA